MTFRARRPARTAAVAERGRIGSGCRTIGRELDQVRAYVLDRLAPALEQIRQTVARVRHHRLSQNAALRRFIAPAMTLCLPGKIKVQARCTKVMARLETGSSLSARPSEHLLRLLLGSSGMFGFFFKTVSQGIVFRRQLIQSLRYRLIANQLGSAPVVKGFRA